MRNIGKRKARNQPCKSPSPDVANKSIIKNTTIQVGDIKAKIKQAQERSIRLDLESSDSQLVHSELNNTTLEMKYRQVYEELNRLKQENSELKEFNRMIKDQNQKLRQQQTRRLVTAQESPISRLGKQPLQQKMMNLDIENQKIIQQLNNQRIRHEQTQRYIQTLQKQNENLSLLNRQYEGKAVSLSNSIVSFNQDFISKINELNSRINKLETLKRVIDEKHSRIMSESHTHKTPPSTGNYEYRLKQLSSSRNQSPQPFVYTYTSPIRSEKDQERQEKLQNENFRLKQEILIKQNELQKAYRDKENLLLSLQDHQRQGPIITPKFSQKPSEPSAFEHTSVLQKITYNYEDQIQQLRQENRLVKQNLASNQKYHQEERNKLLNIIQHHKKLLKGYEQELKHQKCELCELKDRQITHLRQIIDQNERKYQDQLSRIQLSSRIQMDQYRQKVQMSEKHFSEISELQEKNRHLSFKNQQLSQQIQKMREKLSTLKENFQIEEASRLLDENYTIFRDQEKFLNSQQEAYEKAIVEIRESLFIKEEENAGLEKELSLKSKQVQYLQIELGRLKELLRQYKANNRESLTTNLISKSVKNREKIENNSKFRNNQLQILDRIKEGKEKVSNLCQNVYGYQSTFSEQKRQDY